MTRATMFLALATGALLGTTARAGSGPPQWFVHQMLGRSDGTCITATSDDHFVVTGWRFWGYAEDVILMKYNCEGTCVWPGTRTFGGDDDDRGYSVIETHDNGYVVTGATGSLPGGRKVFLAKFDPDGNRLWSHVLHLGDGPAVGNAVIEGPDNFLYVAGTAASLWPPLVYKLFLAKVAPDGSTAEIRALWWYGITCQGVSLVERDGHIVVVGRLIRLGEDSDDIWVLKFTSDTLGLVARRTIGWPDRRETVHGAALHGSSIVITGEAQRVPGGPTSLFLLNVDFDSLGLEWGRILPGPLPSAGYGVVGELPEHIVVVGRYGGDAVVVKWWTTGTLACTGGFDHPVGALAAGARSAAVPPGAGPCGPGYLMLTGYAETIPFGPGPGYLLLAGCNSCGYTCLARPDPPYPLPWTPPNEPGEMCFLSMDPPEMIVWLPTTDWAPELERLCEILLADMNCDGEVNAFDIDPFVLALTDPAGHAAA